MALTRSCDVRHSTSICSRSSRRVSVRSVAARRGSSSASISTEIRRSDATTARRRASVGWAVNTGCTRSPASSSASRSPPSSRRICRTVASSDSGSGCPGTSRSRRARMRWCSSARLARWKYTVKALATCSARSSGHEATRAAMPSGKPPGAGPGFPPPAFSARRDSITACRSCSTSSSSSWPPASLSTPPSKLLSSRTSRRIGSGIRLRSLSRLTVSRSTPQA